MNSFQNLIAAVLISGVALAGTAQAQTTATHPVHKTAVVPSTNPYDNGHANVINKVKEKWRNAKQKTRYTTYKLSHGGKTSTAEKAQDARKEAQDRAHEAQDRAKIAKER